MTIEHTEVPEWRDEINVPAKSLRLYISGPMRGIARTNFPMFDECRDFLHSIGHNAISPADNDRAVDPLVETRPGFLVGDHDDDSPLDFGELMIWDLEQVIRADGIVLLPGWEKSAGADIELHVARGMGKRVFYYNPNALATRDIPPSYSTTLMEERQPTIIGISGYAQAGKDTIGSILTDGAGFVRVAFADALREVLYALDPYSRWTTPHREHGWWGVRDIVDAYGWEYAKANSDVRELLQRLGTEAGRQVLGDDIWVRTAMSKVNGGKYVFTDVRFPNEARAIIDKGGQVWRVEREGCGPVNAHPSESALDDWPFDAVIFNKGTIGDLADQVRLLLG